MSDDQTQNPSPVEQIEEKKPLFKSEEDRRVFTNLTDTILVIADLGNKGGPMGTVVDPETIRPRDSKDLGLLYSDEELLKSKNLRWLVASKMLMEGRPPANFVWPITPGFQLKERGKLANEFEDPTKNVYDDRLKELNAKDLAEDMETRQGGQAQGQGG